MTRSEALSSLRRLASGLHPDVAGVARLMERISRDDEAETLRALLAERGARSLLDCHDYDDGRDGRLVEAGS